ncbi:MAG: ribbon-helix-helix domain-containing protein [Thermoguttaceae bacterium]
MPYTFPPQIDRLVQDRLASGLYSSEDEVLLEAMLALQDRDQTVAAVNEGHADMEAGRVRPLQEVDMEMRKKYGIP